MESAEVLGGRMQYPVGAPGEHAEPATPNHGAASLRVGVLKDLTLALLREVESLRGAGPQKPRERICLSEEVRRFETELICWALARTGGHQRRAARLLDIKVTTLHAKIKRYGIKTGAEVVRGAAPREDEAAAAPPFDERGGDRADTQEAGR